MSTRYLGRLLNGWPSRLSFLSAGVLLLSFPACTDTPDPGTPTVAPSTPTLGPDPATPTLIPATPTATAVPVTESPVTEVPVTATPVITPPPPLDMDGDGILSDEGDCDDGDATVYPGAPENPYDGVDQDCNGSDLIDVDGDGWNALVVGGEDCNDLDLNSYPGAPESADGRDNDCDGLVDEDLDTTDDDADGYAESDGDCDDQDPGVHPDAEEIPYDGIDQDCSGLDLVDVDGDGYAGGEAGSDCDDTQAVIHPGATEQPYDGIDQDCDGADLVDQDGDGAPGGPGGTDCDDLDPARAPGLEEVPYDGIDQDCDGLDMVDQDGDGQVAVLAGGADCDDVNGSIYEGAEEVPYDGIDQDCSGSDLVDVDGDGFVAEEAAGDDCDDENANTWPGAPEFEDDQDNDCDGLVDEDLSSNDDDGDGFAEDAGDCHDGDATIFPQATEVAYDGIDQDCDGVDLTDVDGDGYASANVPDGTDCDDSQALVNPGMIEVAYDGIDQDCSGQDLVDVDGDGYAAASVGGEDCDDSSALVSPAGMEVPYDGIDQDCSGTDLQDVDGDGYPAVQAGGSDCQDGQAAVNPGALEVCDSIDNNCDGVVDLDAADRIFFFTDSDLDGFGDAASPVLTCSLSVGLSENDLDCNDQNAGIYPLAEEQCNGVDDDCDLSVDEGVTTTFYEDGDGDGFGDGDSSIQLCAVETGYVSDATDCDDTMAAVFPGATEVCNGLDDDCDGSVDEGVTTTYYADGDGDGYGDPAASMQACALPVGYVSNSGDCNDNSTSVNPGAPEACNTVDDNCSGSADEGVTFSGVVSSWPAEGNANDQLGTNHGTLVGNTSYVPGKVGQAFSFDGNGDYIDFNSTVANFGTANFTIEFWIRTTGLNGEQAVMGKRAVCAHSSFIDLRQYAGQTHFEIDQDGSSSTYSIYSHTKKVNDNQWHHLAFVREGTRTSIYVDGALDSTQTRSAVTSISNTANFRMGVSACTGADGTTWYNGQLDQITIFNRALSASEIQSIFNLGALPRCLTK